MFRLLILLLTAGFLHSCSSGDAIFVLDPRQSMLMTGKGPGQDAAINPYTKTRSIAIIRSLSPASFDVRIQSDGEIIEIVNVAGKDKKEVILEPGYELYLDTKTTAKAKVTFKQF